jgi:hypothetical protein
LVARLSHSSGRMCDGFRMCHRLGQPEQPE